jgi:hypothetical protein
MSHVHLGLPIPLLFLACIVPPAHAHAILLSSEPATGQVVSGSKVEVTLHFNSRVDAKRSRVTLVAPDTHAQSLVVGSQPTADLLTSEASGLKAGAYIIRWQVLATDGHISRGEVPFRVR